MAKAKPSTGESKAPLVIALAFFVLTTLILGVLTYMAYDQLAAQKAAAKEAADKERAAQGQLSEEQAKVRMYKVLIGANTQEEFDNLKNGGKDDAVRKEYTAVMEGVKNRLQGTVTKEMKNFVGNQVKFNVPQDAVVKWTWPEGTKLDSVNPPEQPMVDAVVASYARQQLAAIELSTKQAALDKALQDYQDQRDRAQKAEAEFKKLSAEFPTQVKAIQAKADELVAAVRGTFGKETAKYTADIKAKAEQLEQQKILLDDAVAKATGLGNQVKRYEEKELDTQDPFEFDRPHGRIIRRQGNMVTIDIGSADNVRPGLTLSAQPSDTPQRGLQHRTRPRIGADGRPVVDQAGRPVLDVYPKGTIEVVEVLGPNTSQARITSEPDRIREAIMVGDVLYNPAWRKGGADHVALFGVFDVDADGIDDIRQVVRDLGRMGIVVDAYFDLEKKQWVGKVTEQTTYAVEGYYPVQTGGDALAAAKSALDQALREARSQARDKGVKVVKARTFFNRIGYNIRLDITTETINRAFNRYLQTAAPMGEAGAPAEPMKN